jgi:hypothetical protein
MDLSEEASTAGNEIYDILQYMRTCRVMDTNTNIAPSGIDYPLTQGLINLSSMNQWVQAWQEERVARPQLSLSQLHMLLRRKSRWLRSKMLRKLHLQPPLQ